MAEMIPDGQGSLVLVAVANPTAGDNFSHTMPARVRWRLISVTFKFTSSATSADRFFNLDIEAGLAIIARFGAREEGVASQVRQVSFYAGGIYTMDATHLFSLGSLPEKLLLNNERKIVSAIQGIQSADQITDAYLLVEEWIEPLA